MKTDAARAPSGDAERRVDVKNGAEPRVAAARRASIHVIALLLATLITPAVACADQWASFRNSEGPGGGGRDVVILWLFYASTQCLLTIATVPALVLIRRGWWKSGWLLWLAWQVALFGVLDADRQTYFRTNIHLSGYIPFLFIPSATVWAGDISVGSTLGGFAGRAAWTVMLAPIVGAIAVALLVRWRCSAKSGKRIAGGLAVAVVLACVGVVPAQTLNRDRGRLARAHASLPLNFRWSASGFASVDTAAFEDAFNARLGDAARRVWDDGSGAPPATQPALAPLPGDARRDVVLIIIESLRADVLNADVMPRTFALARDGMRLNRHVSGAKFTQFAIYNLLTSRPALIYTADGGRTTSPPVAAAAFRKIGYVSRFHAAADYHWRGLEHVIDSGTFRRTESFARGSWNLSDHLTLEATARALATPGGGPRFVTSYLVSTHFPYKYPKEFETRTPVVSPRTNILKIGETDGRTGMLNRYHNACSYVDDEVATLVSKLDLSKTVVAITGDHGESFWDDNGLTHGGRWSDVAVHVPFVLLGAGVPRGVEYDEPTCHQDVMPTLLRLATGRHVPLVGSIGRDVFEPAEVPAAGDVRLICSEAVESYGQALFERGDRRLLMQFPRGQGKAIVLGSVDRKGSVDSYDAPPTTDAAAWADGVAGILRRISDPTPR